MACCLSKYRSTLKLVCTIVVVIIIASLFEDPSKTEIKTIKRLEGSEEVIAIEGGAVGPESFAFDPQGDGPYTGVSDGRIIKWLANESRWLDFAITTPYRAGCEGFHDHSKSEERCGRPLGLDFDRNSGDLYIADSHFGLLVVGPNGGLATKVAGQNFGFTNSLYIDQTHRVLYFTDSSTTFSRRQYVSVIVSGDNTGRLMKYDMKTKQLSVLLNNLSFPNGVSMSKNGDFLLVTETTTCKVLKFWLKNPIAGTVEVISHLPGFPDNIKRNPKGEFWVGVNSRRSKFLKWILSKNWIINKLLPIIPFDITKAHSYIANTVGVGTGSLAIRLSEDGTVLEIIEPQRWKFVSEVHEMKENLWVGSVNMPFVRKHKLAT